MKKAIVFIVSFCLFAVLNSACDPCKDKSCGYGVCNDGTCDCDCGASKDANGDCTVKDRDLYIGTYTATGNSSNGGSFPDFEIRCNALGAAFNLIEFDLSAIGFPKFKGRKECNDTITFDMVDDTSTGDKYTGYVARTGNILTIIVKRTTSIGTEITYTVTGNKI